MDAGSGPDRFEQIAATARHDKWLHTNPVRIASREQASAGTPPAIVQRLNGVLHELLSDPEVAKSVQRHGLNPAASTPQEFTARIRSDYAKWRRVLKAN